MILWLLACQTPAENPLDTAICDEDLPRITWQTFGAGFLTNYCQGCHGSDVLDRQGAPEEAIFDTEEDAWYWSEKILTATLAVDATMPPMGGVPEDELDRLRRWLRCESPPEEEPSP